MGECQAGLPDSALSMVASAEESRIFPAIRSRIRPRLHRPKSTPRGCRYGGRLHGERDVSFVADRNLGDRLPRCTD